MAVSVSLPRIRAIGAWQETKGAVMLAGNLHRTEGRAAVTPKMVSMAAERGIKTNLGSGIGDLSGFSDSDYVSAGAKMYPHTPEGIAAIMNDSQLLVRVKELQADALIGGTTVNEFEMLRVANLAEPKVAALYVHAGSEEELAVNFAGTGAVCVAYETVKEPDRSVPMLDCMSRLTGDALAKKMSGVNWQTGGPLSLVSGYYGAQSPMNVLLIGGGNVGASAAVFLLGAGANVRILDTYPDNPVSHFERMISQGFPKWLRAEHIASFDIRNMTDAEVSEGLEWANGGQILTSVKNLDRPGSPADKVINDGHFETMMPGTSIFDAAIDQGGATSRSHATEHGATEAYIVDSDVVVHPDGDFSHPGTRMYCVDHVPGAFPRTATLALTEATAPYILDIASLGLQGAIARRPSLLGGINTISGHLTLQSVTDKFGLGHLFAPVEEISFG